RTRRMPTGPHGRVPEQGLARIAAPSSCVVPYVGRSFRGVKVLLYVGGQREGNTHVGRLAAGGTPPARGRAEPVRDGRQRGGRLPGQAATPFGGGRVVG